MLTPAHLPHAFVAREAEQGGPHDMDLNQQLPLLSDHRGRDSCRDHLTLIPESVLAPHSRLKQLTVPGAISQGDPDLPRSCFRASRGS